MEKTKRKSLVLTLLFAFVMTFGAMFGLAGCIGLDDVNDANGNFECAGKRFVYDNWEATEQLSDDQNLIITGMAMASYGKGEFVFNADGTFVQRNTETGENTWQGTWEIVDQTVVLTMPDESSEVLTIVGKRFYIVQQMNETVFLHFYYKVA